MVTDKIKEDEYYIIAFHGEPKEFNEFFFKRQFIYIGYINKENIKDINEDDKKKKKFKSYLFNNLKTKYESLGDAFNKAISDNQKFVNSDYYPEKFGLILVDKFNRYDNRVFIFNRGGIYSKKNENKNEISFIIPEPFLIPIGTLDNDYFIRSLISSELFKPIHSVKAFVQGLDKNNYEGIDINDHKYKRTVDYMNFLSVTECLLKSKEEIREIKEYSAIYKFQRLLKRRRLSLKGFMEALKLPLRL